MAESESKHLEEQHQLNKRLDALTMLVEYLQKELNRLVEESESTKTILTKLQISMATFNDYMDRYRELERKMDGLGIAFTAHTEKFDSLKNSMSEIKGLLWTLAAGMLTILGTIGWDIAKQFLHFN